MWAHSVVGRGWLMSHAEHQLGSMGGGGDIAYGRAYLLVMGLARVLGSRCGTPRSEPVVAHPVRGPSWHPVRDPLWPTLVRVDPVARDTTWLAWAVVEIQYIEEHIFIGYELVSLNLTLFGTCCGTPRSV